MGKHKHKSPAAGHINWYRSDQDLQPADTESNKKQNKKLRRKETQFLQFFFSQGQIRRKGQQRDKHRKSVTTPNFKSNKELQRTHQEVFSGNTGQ